MTDPNWTVDDVGDPRFGAAIVVVSSKIAGVARRCTNDASLSVAVFEQAAHAALVRCVRDAGLLPAALNLLQRWHLVATQGADDIPLPRETRELFDRVRDRRP